MNPMLGRLLAAVAVSGVATGCPDTTSSQSGLQAVPDASYGDCDPDDACCLSVYCMDPEPGEACPDIDESQAQAIAGPDPFCSYTTCDLEGPYSDEGVEEYSPLTPGSCCYTFGLIVDVCEGRPLLVDQIARMAACVSRDGWS